MAYKFFILFIFFSVINTKKTYSQSPEIDRFKADTFKIIYLVWQPNNKTDTLILVQKKGYVVKFHSNNFIPENNKSYQDIAILNDKKLLERGNVLEYVFY